MIQNKKSIQQLNRASKGKRQALPPETCSVEHVTHEVIEGKLLNALAEGGKVAAILTQENLIDLLAAAHSYPYDSARKLRLRQLAKGMSQLLSEAFPPNDKSSNPASTI